MSITTAFLADAIAGVHERLRAAGCSPVQTELMLALAGTPRPLGVLRIQDVYGIPRETAARNLRALVRRGWALRAAHPDHPHMIGYTPTPEGLRRVRDALAPLQTW